MPLQHLTYISVAAPGIGPEDIELILAQSRRNNASRAISGHLQCHGGLFFQILEGPGAALDALLERLRADTRHADLRLLFREPLQRRHFADWSMGYGPCVADAADTPAAERLRRLRDAGPQGAERTLTLFLSLMAREGA
jgi:hypothetical protein